MLQFFFAPGGRNPESFLSSFSKGVQRAAFKARSSINPINLSLKYLINILVIQQG